MDLQIIHVVMGKANPDRMNGVNKVVNSLANAQVKLGYEVSVWGITHSDIHNYPFRSYRTCLFKNCGHFSLDKKLKLALANLDPTHVHFHIHGGFIPQLFMVAIALKHFGFKFTYTPHGAFNTVALNRSKWKKKLYVALFERRLLRAAHRVHLIGQSEVSGTKRLFGKVAHVLIPNGQEAGLVKPVNSKQKAESVFGFVGRLDMHTKGLDLLLNGFAQAKRNPTFNGQLWLVGDGPDLHKIHALVHHLGIKDSVLFKGALFGLKKRRCLQQFTYLCLNSRNEGLPGVVLEAASLGIPSIVSIETNLGTYIRTNEAGWVTEENSPKAIAHALESAHQFKQWGLSKQQGINAFRMVKSQFDWKHIAAQHIESYAA